MKTKLARISSRARSSCTLGLFLSVFATSAAFAQYQGTPDQRRACTPDVYRLCAGEIPNVRAITAFVGAALMLFGLLLDRSDQV